jgi:hypothetical protein
MASQTSYYISYQDGCVSELVRVISSKAAVYGETFVSGNWQRDPSINKFRSQPSGTEITEEEALDLVKRWSEG